MPNNSTNNSRIAKNTGMLYVRMLLIMFVTLYTSRVVLKVLGEEDFGIYNVVGGVVTMFTFLNSALNTATQRYLNFEMGKGNTEGMKNIFSMSFWSFGLLAIVAVILAETIGLWFVNTQLTIPEGRMAVARWVYHFSVLSFVINLVTVPYNAAIIAHEKMSIYAYVSICEVVLKLLLVFLLTTIGIDKLWLYSFMMLLVTCAISVTYWIICRRYFEECKLKWLWNRELFKGLFSFSGWMLSGTVTNILSTQGVNILINIFFGPLLNAARGVAMQIYSAVNGFVANFMTAVKPQIVKSYAQGDTTYMYRLVFSSSKIAFYLLLILITPIFFNVHEVLDLWLDKVPDKAELFTRLVLINLLIVSAYTSIAYISQASGKIRDYQLVISIGFTLIALLTWLAFKIGMPVESTFYIAIGIDILGLWARLWVLKRIVDFPVSSYLVEVIIPISAVLVISIGGALLVGFLIRTSSIILLLINMAIMMAVTVVSIWFVGMDKSEKQMVRSMATKIIRM